MEVSESLAKERVENRERRLGVTPKFSQLIQDNRAVKSEGEIKHMKPGLFLVKYEF